MKDNVNINNLIIQIEILIIQDYNLFRIYKKMFYFEKYARRLIVNTNTLKIWIDISEIM